MAVARVQGETLEQQFGEKEVCFRTLDLYTSAVLESSLNPVKPPLSQFRDAMDAMAKAGALHSDGPSFQSCHRGTWPLLKAVLCNSLFDKHSAQHLSLVCIGRLFDLYQKITYLMLNRYQFSQALSVVCVACGRCAGVVQRVQGGGARRPALHRVLPGRHARLRARPHEHRQPPRQAQGRRQVLNGPPAL